MLNLIYYGFPQGITQVIPSVLAHGKLFRVGYLSPSIPRSLTNSFRLLAIKNFIQTKIRMKQGVDRIL